VSETDNPYAEEAEARWGETDAYRESERRLSRYTPEQKAMAFHAQQRATQLVIEAKRSGHPAGSDEARAAAEACRLAIDEWFYPCDTQMHVNLADMYVADERFAEHYESLEPGLAQYLHDAIYANHRNAL
jgi:hypothetical protein